MTSNNPREAIGGNQAPDFSKIETDRLIQDYGNLKKTLEEIVDEAKKITDIVDDDDKERVITLIKRIRDTRKMVEGFHESEKQPHLRRGQAVDQFFFGMIDQLLKRNKRDRDGIGDTLGSMLTAYDTRKLAEEQERRRLAAEEAERIRLAAIAEQREKDRLAEEARLAAERARNPERKEEKQEIAAQAEEAASAATVEVAVAEHKAEEAYVATLAKPADIMRTRGADGTLSTMGTEKFSEIIDRTKIDAAGMMRLLPHIPYADLEKALRGYATSVGHSEDAAVQIAGCRFGKRPKSRVQ